MNTQSYPYERWPKLTRRQLRAGSALTAVANSGTARAALDEARSLLGDVLELRTGAIAFESAEERGARLRASADVELVVLEATAALLGATLLLEIPRTFAEQLVDRVLGGDATLTLAPSLQPLDDMSRGALAYLIARCLTKWQANLCLRNITSDPSCVQLLGAAPSMAWPIELRLGQHSAVLRLHAPESLPLPQRTRRGPAQLTQVPLNLSAQVGRSTLTASELRTLGPSDIVMLDACSLVYDGTQFTGQARLHIEHSRNYFLCRAHDRGIEIESRIRSEEPAMTRARSSQPPEPATTPTLATDAPIELGVELARFTLTLGEIERLQPGDVLITGRRIGELVTLRAAGRAFAQAELVDVEGEVGVRIQEFLKPEPG